jgi:hypothetical protein
MHAILRREGFEVNRKRVYRIYCAAGLSAPSPEGATPSASVNVDLDAELRGATEAIAARREREAVEISSRFRRNLRVIASSMPHARWRAGRFAASPATQRRRSRSPVALKTRKERLSLVLLRHHKTAPNGG